VRLTPGVVVTLVSAVLPGCDGHDRAFARDVARIYGKECFATGNGKSACDCLTAEIQSTVRFRDSEYDVGDKILAAQRKCRMKPLPSTRGWEREPRSTGLD